MLIGLAIRDLVLIKALELSFGPGLTVLTGETGAGKSIILDALGLATGARGEAALVRPGASQATAGAVFTLSADHPARALLREKGLEVGQEEDLVLRRALGADGRSRAFVNDQTAGVALLRELGALIMEVHGQHETSGLLEARSHRELLDAFGGDTAALHATRSTWDTWRAARERAQTARADLGLRAREQEGLAALLADLDALAPRQGEEELLAQERALLGGAEKTLAEIEAARTHLGEGVLAERLAQALRALERARDQVARTGAGEDQADARRIGAAIQAVDRALVEITEAAETVDAAGRGFAPDPGRLDQVEERLFALRGMARRLSTAVDDLPRLRAETAARLMSLEDADTALAEAEAVAAAARDAYFAAARTLSAKRTLAAAQLEAAVSAELPPLKLEKARFRVRLDEAAEERAGPAGLDKVEFEVATLPGAPFGALAAIASGGELARLALAIKVSLARSQQGAPPLMVFDEVDQGVGGAVADAVGQRLARLAEVAQVVVVTHSPQVAARADAHWRVSRGEEGERARAAVEVLAPASREEEIARMLSGARITDAARAAARALMDA